AMCTTSGAKSTVRSSRSCCIHCPASASSWRRWKKSDTGRSGAGLAGLPSHNHRVAPFQRGGAAFTRFALHRDLPAKAVAQPFDDGEAQAEPLGTGFAAFKRLENALQQFLAHARAGVADRQSSVADVHRDLTLLGVAERIAQQV